MMASYLAKIGHGAPRTHQLNVDGDVAETVELGERLVALITATADRAGRHLTIRSEEAMHSVRRARSLLFVALGVALVVGLATALHLQQCLTRPIGSIIAGIKRVQGGDHEHRIELNGDVEFRDVAVAFNDAYEELQGSQRALAHAEKLAAVGQLAAGVSHEVLNPLASISSTTQILRSRLELPENIEKTDLIIKHIGRVTKILRDLQVSSRPEELEAPIDVNVHAALDYAIALVGYDQRAKSVSIVRQYDSEVAVVHGYVDRLLSVFTNILFNALDAVSDSVVVDGKIQVCSRLDGKTVEVCVSDNGPGMTKEQITHAFEPFFTTKPTGAGTGLGLWISHRIVDTHGGSIAIKSGVREGTNVAVRLPACTQKPSER
jgi:signal transduction histidine kinase